MRLRHVFLVLLALGVVPRAGAVGAADRASGERGREVYTTYCGGCHGEKGDGKGPAAEMLIVKPRDFTKGVYKFRSTPTGELPTTEDLYRTITLGAYPTSMPAWPLLSERERYAVIETVKGFYPDWEKRGAGVPIDIPQPPESLGTSESIARGRQVYELLECAKCHGDTGRGDGPSADSLDADIWGNPQKPFDFTSGRLKGGPNPEDVYRTFMTGIGGTAMPSFADIFAEPDGEYIFAGDAWNLVSYVLSLRRSRPQTWLTRKEPSP